MIDEPFIDSNIWEIKQWPIIDSFMYQLNDIYYYNSLVSDLEDKKQSTFIQIPEILIGNKEYISIVLDNKDFIISNNIPILEKIND